MRCASACWLSFILATAAMGQSPASNPVPLPALPKEPAEIFAAAAPSYDFASVKKPWHMKVSYQLYDEKSQPTEKGTYEYWWASPETYRSTWKRPGMEETVWMSGGKRSGILQGPRKSFVEERLQAALLDPLPHSDDLVQAHVETDERILGSTKLRCVTVIPKSADGMRELPPPTGMFPAYCFETQRAVLRISGASVGVQVTYSSIAQMQGVLLARDIAIFDHGEQALSARVEAIESIPASAPELLPQSNAVSEPKTGIFKFDPDVTAAKLTSRADALFPLNEKQWTRNGSVSVRLTVGTDGRPHDLRVISGTSPSFVTEAVRAVLQYRFKPGLYQGAPVNFEMKVEIDFHLT